MSGLFELQQFEHSSRVTVLRLRGHLDARSAGQLTARAAAVRAAGRHLVLNLSGVEISASSGVGALLALVEEFRRSPASVRLCDVSPTVSSVIQLLNLDPFLPQDGDESTSCGALEAA